MWTLECDGDSLSNQKIWLRPGKKYLFGRTKQPTGGRDAGFRVEHKSISRQHLTIIVANVQSGNGTVVNTKSEITLKDENTKFKTEIDGEKIQNDSRVLRKAEHVFKLGNLDHVFRIKWQPVVFTFSFSSKEMKKGNDPLNGYRIRLEELDVKVTLDYVIGQTTHVVAGKRNTAKGLQALINAKHIVSDTFIDALVYATTPSNLDEAESLSPLEEDFDGNWPHEKQYLPAKSKEPSERPAEEFEPNLERCDVFEGYTFVFCDAIQFDALHRPITNGGGKALEFKIRPGLTSADEVVRFVKDAAGEKGLGELEDGSEGKGVVVIKFRGSKGFEDWAADLDREVAQALDLRLIEQSEFLDAILANDASILRRPLLPAEIDSAGGASTMPSAHTNGMNDMSETKASQPPVKRRPLGKIISRFKGFDDDDDQDGSFISSYPQAARTPAPPADNLANKAEWRPDGSSFGDTNEMNPESQAAAIGRDSHTNQRKRPAPSSDNDDGEDLIDKLLPAATALKRRRLEDEANGLTVDDSLQAMSQAHQKSAKAAAAKPPRKELNVKDLVRERRAAMDSAAQEDEQSLRETLDGMTVEEMKRLAVVEEMDIPHRRLPQGRTNGENNPRWDERWNGRKNFKKFRRHGDNPQSVRRGPSVIVPLEEAKRKDFGIGEAYWQDRNGRARGQDSKDQRSQAQVHSQSQSQREAAQTAADSHTHTATVPAELVAGIGDSSEPEVIDVDAPRTTRGSERSTQQYDKISSNSVRTATSQVASGGKRQAAEGQMVPPMVKKRKKFAAARDSDSDD